MNKPYKLGIIVGRFQTLHKGHVEMISTALGLCETVGIFIGSSQESGTANNPFTYKTRRVMIENVFGTAVKVFPLPDIGVGNTAKWGEYVLSNVRERFGELPDLLVSGKETRRSDWLNYDEGRTIAELYVPKTVEISASEMRGLLIADKREEWCGFSPAQNHYLYGTLREQAIASKDNLNTMSV